MTDTPALMSGKRGLIMGVANDHSIAWGIADMLHRHGAELAFTFQGEAFERRVRPLAESVNAKAVVPCDVEDETSMRQAFEKVGAAFGNQIDFVVHAIAYSDKEELKGRYLNTTRGNFGRSLMISCYSFTEVARLAQPYMSKGGSLITLTYEGSTRVMPNYNVMGVAKAALEASVRYLAVDLGPQNIRVNAVSPGPMRTLAGSAIGSARATFKFTAQHSPLRRNASLDEVGGAALFLLSDLGAGVTGEIVHVDSGFHTLGMPNPADLQNGGNGGNGEG
ncbi:MAG: SDR family oxidoreductase [Ferrovibrio sp.]|uniref:enoyl-ACP reductase FabI n=1 Tax=Ferrovibrio sp. TaxID=1917215 RepID=UPI00261A6730|nr:SDR family oxidoreductase [Ferrovibrio sp.]MCW0233917.1 SDR family oxidoreductase [Ferrovibrio sp.]